MISSIDQQRYQDRTKRWFPHYEDPPGVCHSDRLAILIEESEEGQPTVAKLTLYLFMIGSGSKRPSPSFQM
jgi:hypothetical protein